MHIFLDFDGVLHPDAVVVQRNKPMELHTEGELFMHAPVLIDALAAYPEAKIILSTSWVRVYGYKGTLKRMPSELVERVVGATYHSKMQTTPSMYGTGYESFQTLSRYQQIYGHVYRNKVKDWLAIDDLHSGSQVRFWPKYELKNLVLTEESKGLSCNKAQADLKGKLHQFKFKG
jgi:hypothetical protein